jgi:hypothetical protein
MLRFLYWNVNTMTLMRYRSFRRLTGLPAKLTVAVITLFMASSVEVQAQNLGLNLRGDVGMKSGSQPGPGYYLIVPLYYRSDYGSLRGPNGNEVPGQIETDISLVAPALAVTTKAKILGANYGFQVVPIFMNQRLAVAAIGAEAESGYGFGDMYVQPINLGWHTARADFLAAYGFYAPTGSGNRSLDMWAHEFAAGTTVYFDEAKNWHAAATVFYDIHQRKRSQDVTVGNFMTLEGGLGRSFLKGAGSAGLAYVVQLKTTDDSGADLGPLAIGSRNKAYGLGPEINFPLFAKGTLVGILGVRYTFEFGNSTNFQGNNLAVSLTLAKLRLN